MKTKKRKKHSQAKELWRRFKKRKTAVIGLVILIIMAVIVVFAPIIAPYPYAEMDLSNAMKYPSLAHIMGTDNFGRDIFSRVVYGARTSLSVALTSVVISIAFGTVLGTTAAFYGGKYENLIMRIMDILMAIPSTLMAISLSAAMGTGILTTIIAISFTAIPSFTRVTRATAMSVREMEYVEAARCIGANNRRQLLRHILPNCIAPIVVQSTTSIVSAISLISTLSFIGLGVQPPAAEWGSMLSAGREFIRSFYPMVVFPGLMIVFTLIGFNLFGDGLRDALDPRLKQ